MNLFLNPKISKIALIVVYNHRYDNNISIIEKLYLNRFADIFHLMPFYDGDKPNVIPVYENSHYFQGYIAQGLKSFFNEEYEHYLFVADDMVLNPIINEKNYKEIFKIDAETDFVTGISSLPNFWKWNKNAIEYRTKQKGIEFVNLLPNYNEALSKMESFGIKQEKIYPYLYKKLRLFWKKHKPQYPLAMGYSDIAIVSKHSIKKFCHYCGIFSASNLFVELALPTSLILACKKLTREKDLLLQGRALWTKEDYKILEKYQQNLKKLLDDFPKDYIYLHPIKFSKWNTEDLCKE